MKEQLVLPSQNQIDELVSSILSFIESTKQEAESTTAIDLKEQLYQYVDEAQGVLNNLLKKSGVITKDQIDQLDEKVRETKQKILLEKATQSQRRIIIGTIAAIGVVGLLWYIIKK